MFHVLDYLGGANYGDLIVRNHPMGFGAGAILNTNKPEWPKTDFWRVAERLGKSKNMPMLRVHAIWEDNHLYDPKKHNAIIVKEFDRMVNFKSKYPWVECYFSPMCERDNKSPEYDTLLRRFSENRFGITIVNSVSKGPFWIDSTIINELHGDKRKPSWGRWAYSTDGKQAWDQNIVELRKSPGSASLQYFAYWVSMFNGKWNDKGPGEKGADTTKRNLRKAWPYKEVFPALSALAESPSGVRLSSRHIWKTHADQHGPERQPREGKPVFITTADGPSCKVKTLLGGKEVTELRRDRVYVDGRPKYRANEFGYQIAEKARKLSGSPMVVLVVSGKEVGVVHPAFRAGTWRD